MKTIQKSRSINLKKKNPLFSLMLLLFGTFLYEGDLNSSEDYFSLNSFNICGK